MKNINPISSLVGLSVSEVVEVHDYVRVVFEDGARLSIFNLFELSPSSIKLHHLQDLRILSAEHNDKCMKSVFDGHISLKVDLTDNAYQGPESVQLTRAGQPSVVWS